MKQATLEELDYWLFNGLGGLVNMIQQRLELSAPPSRVQWAVLENQLDRLADLIGKYQAGDQVPQEAAQLKLFDVWLIRGFKALLEMVDARIANGVPLEPGNMDTILTLVNALRDQINKS